MKTNEEGIVVLDANAFIHSTNLMEICKKCRIITTKSVIEELKDENTRDKIKELPFQIQQKDPSQRSIQFVKQFAKKTGDIGSLSDVDIQLLALTHTLYLENGLQEKIQKHPSTPQEKKRIEVFDLELDQDEQSNQQQDIKEQNQEDDEDGWIKVPIKHKPIEESSDSDMDQEEGWVTPSNFNEKMKETATVFQPQNESEQKKWQISLMTSDFSMQNVAVQMGLHLISIEGRAIKQIRRFLWQCYLCWTQNKISDNKVRLCINCGYNSLSKVAYSIDSNGNTIIHRKKGWKPNKNVLEWKQRKLDQQQRKKKHQHARRKKKPSIFETV